jgi:hypothetical protein
MPEVLARRSQATRRILRNNRKRQRLGQRQRGDRLAEIDQACRARAFHVAAVGRVVEIGLKNVALRIEQFELGARPICSSLPTACAC